MIDGINNLLAGTDQPGLPELRRYLVKMFAAQDDTCKFIEVTKLLRSRVFRVKLEIRGAKRSLVIKRLSPELAHRERNVFKHWLPRFGLDRRGPPLLGSVAEQSGRCIWHVYEDLGQWTLDKHIDDTDFVHAATVLIGQLHSQSASHPLLAECRSSGVEYSNCFYNSSVSDAVRSLEAIQSLHIDLSPKQHAIVCNLLEHLHNLWEQRTYRAEVLSEYGGPETLLHGDLWTTNIFVIPGRKVLDVRLIDWDHIGVGQVSYDLSTYLLRFPVDKRQDIFDTYQEVIEPINWTPPSPDLFNLLCETAEYSRLANAIIWPAICAANNDTEWVFDDLKKIDQWFNNLSPVFPADVLETTS